MKMNNMKIKEINQCEELFYRMTLYPIKDVDTIEWVAEIPDLPGCIGCGDTPEEAIAMAKDAQRGWLKNAIDNNIKIPQPTNPYDAEYSGKFTLRLPKTMHRDIAIKSEEEQVSINQLIIFMLSKELYQKSSSHHEAKDNVCKVVVTETKTNEILFNDTKGLWENSGKQELDLNRLITNGRFLYGT